MEPETFVTHRTTVEKRQIARMTKQDANIIDAIEEYCEAYVLGFFEAESRDEDDLVAPVGVLVAARARRTDSVTARGS
jgi:hypothetical protein